MPLEEEIKQKNFKTVQEKGIINIIYTFNWIDSRMKTFLKSFDLTPQQYNILRILRGQFPQPSTINLIKERMLDKMSDSSRIVERLRRKGLLERKTCKLDRRSVDILISDSGLKLLETIDLVMEDHVADTFRNLSEKESELLNALLDKLRGCPH